MVHAFIIPDTALFSTLWKNFGLPDSSTGHGATSLGAYLDKMSAPWFSGHPCRGKNEVPWKLARFPKGFCTSSGCRVTQTL